MELFTLIRELLRYLKAKWYWILVFSLIAGLIAPTAKVFLNRFETPEMAEAYQDLTSRYSQEAASFQFIIQNEDGTMFTNAALIDEYLSQKEIVDRVQDETGIQYATPLENERVLELYKTSQFRGGIAAIRNSSSDIMTLRILVGQSVEENLKIAQAYADILMHNQIPFLSGKTVELIHSVTDQPLLSDKMYPNLTSEKSLQVVNPINKKSLVILFLAAIMAGGLMGIFFLLVLRLKDRKIRYAFDYAWGLDDLHVLYPIKSNQTLQELIELPKGLNRIVLCQEELDQIHTDSNFVEHQSSIDEVVILVIEGKTSKAWYQDMYRLATLYKLPVKIIQVSEGAI